MKLCYFLQELRGAPLGYHFTLYSYGPFDSEVLSDLGTAEAIRAVDSEVVSYQGGYGYKIQKGEKAEVIIQMGGPFLLKHRQSLDWVISEFGSLSSSDLELLSTIVYVDREASRRTESISIETLTRKVRDVKPHFQESYIRDKALHLLGKALLRATQATV